MFAYPLRRSALLLVGAFVFVLLAACAGQSPAQPAASNASAGGAPASNVSTNNASTGSAPATTLEIHAAEFTFTPSSLNVEKPGRYTVRLINDGKIAHDITFSNGVTVPANAGESKSVDVDVPAAGLTFHCSIPGHGDAGMKGTISVAGNAPVADTGNQADHQMAANTTIQPDPNAPPPPFVDPAAPALMSGTVHNLDITVEEQDMTIVPGVVQHVWTFNGTVPAPTLRVRVGDTIHVKFTNAPGNKLPHSLDFHASQVAVNDEMRTINPGQSIEVEWKADYAGIFMYHCVTGPPVHHVASGMYGMVIVEPKEGLPKVDKEFVIVQNEWYFGGQHDIISLAKASAGAPSPDYMAFNGIPNQYVDHPLQAEKGNRIRFFVLNVGPNLESSFHIVGMIFDTVIKEGVALTRDNPGHYGSQAVDLAPAQGAIVETVAPENGLYDVVTHTFNFHDRGAHATLQIGDGKPETLK